MITRRVRLGDTEYVDVSHDGISHVQPTREGGESRRRVVSGHVEPLGGLVVDDETYSRARLDKEIVCRADELGRRLRREGKVLSRAHADDAINAVLNDLSGAAKRGHVAVGVYEADRTMSFCADPLPILELQRTVRDELHTALARPVASESDVRAYTDFISHVHPFEALPAMGLAALAPVALVLRSAGVLVPGVLHVGERDLGKYGARDPDELGVQILASEVLEIAVARTVHPRPPPRRSPRPCYPLS